MARFGGYIRVSRVGGRSGEGYISPTIQRDAIASYASEIGGEIGEWFTDEDVSGGTAERPAFQAALERVGDDLDGIVVMRIDRFARSVADGARIVRELGDAGAVFASCHERIDPRTPEGRFMLTSFLANAELFLDQVKAGWETAKARAVARGVHIGPTPIGYRRKHSAPLEVDPHYGPAIGELFRRASRGEGPTKLARWMSERAPRPHRRPWRASEVSRWLRSRVYLGEVRYGALVNARAHPPLVDEQTFEAAQREPGVQRRAQTPFLLSGLIRCANCRYTMGGQSAGGFKRDTPVYRCSGRCDAPSVITAAKVEDYVVGLVRRHLGELRLEAVEEGADLIALEATLEQAEGELAAFASDLGARRMLGEDGWQAALRSRALARDDARAAVDETRSRQVASSVEVDELSRHELRSLLGGLIAQVFVRRGRGPAAERVQVMWAGEGVDVPGPHRSGIFDPVTW